MTGSTNKRKAWGACLLVAGAGVWLAASLGSCNTAPQPFIVRGRPPTGNIPPTLNIAEPVTNLTADQGSNFLIRWTDTDPDSNAKVSFQVIDIATNTVITLVGGIDENDTVGPDQFTVSTVLVPVGAYNLRGIIQDNDNPPVTTFAMSNAGGTEQRVILRVVEPGQGPQTVPPTIAVMQPAFNQSVAQDDMITVAVQPSLINPAAPNAPAFDPDSNIQLFVLLDVDLNPNNDDPANPDPNKIIVLEQRTISMGNTTTPDFQIQVDLATIPPRPGGEPYFIRITADDLVNPRVHQYAVGTINVVELASGFVDLFNIGKTVSGVRFYGFNPGANLGSSVASISDFDNDNIDDFVLVAQFGNPRNFGLIGEAYGIYGQDRIRFGGAIAVNSVGDSVDGVIFEAPPIRSATIPGVNARTDGISDVSFVPDLTGDGRPEILFGLQHVHGAIDSMDYDPSDQDLSTNDRPVNVMVTLRQGEAMFTIDNGDPTINFQYAGLSDTVINSATPTTPLASTSELSWQDNGVNNRQWSLIKISDVLKEIPDNPSNIDPSSLQATLSFRVFRTGGDATLHQLFTDFNDQTTFANFAKGGGDPQGGLATDPNADYLVSGSGAQTGLGTLTAAMAESVTVDLRDLIRQLIDGELRDSSNDELRLILVPSATDGAMEASARSSEFQFTDDRPTLTINYTRRDSGTANGCYPDDMVNNTTDDNTADPFDFEFYAGGMALMVNSQNRDNSNISGINPTRLNATVVTLELVGGGDEGRILLDADGVNQEGAGIFARADNTAADVLGGEQGQANRISGARFFAGGFDFVDARQLNQGPREGLFGQKVASIGDLNNDGLSEIMVSAPRNERYVQDLFDNFGFQSTQRISTLFRGSIVVFPGTDYNDNFWRDMPSNDGGNSFVPSLDHQHFPPFGSCTTPFSERSFFTPADTFEVFAENVDDMLGGASSAGDFNQDGPEDILCGAPRNDRTPSQTDTGAAYVIYGRNVIGNFNLSNADDRFLRPPMLRIRGLKSGDQIGWRQQTGLDVNGDRVNDVFIASPKTDFGGVRRTACAGDFNRDGVIDAADVDLFSFNACRNSVGEEVFSDDTCKVFDYNNDGVIDDEDEDVVRCLDGGGTDCCGDLVDNGFVGIIFGGVFIDGDRTIAQIATSDLPGTIFFGSGVGHRAGMDVASAGDFNQDGFGDILIAAPGETRVDDAGRERLGVVYLVFGGTHLQNTVWNLSQVGSVDLPGIVFISPYVKGRPNEAAPTKVAFLGDINNDGFGDVAIGNSKADFIDFSFPQGPNATDAEVGRRRNAGDVYVIYGNNFGNNRTQR